MITTGGRRVVLCGALSLWALSCGSSGPAGAARPQCGNGVVEQGEVCDFSAPGDQSGCSVNCTSKCGNGIVEPGEVCDDGNQEDDLACSASCLASCGNGTIEAPETCDDGNTAEGDGCYRCRKPGDLLWHPDISCDGSVLPGNADTFVVTCENDRQHLFKRYTFGGEVTMGPPAFSDPNEEFLAPADLVELSTGELYVAAQVQRNGTTATQARVRIYHLNADGSVIWSTDLTPFPNGPDEFTNAMAVADGKLVVVGLSEDSGAGTKSHPFAVLLNPDGSVAWKTILPVDGQAQAVAIGTDGTVFVAGGSGYSAEATDYQAGSAWALDSTGHPLWSWNSPTSYVGGAPDLRLTDTSLQVLTWQVTLDDLVPNPPRVASSWSVRALDLGTGAEVESHTTWSETSNGVVWQKLKFDLRGGKFSHSDAFESFYYGSSGATGVLANGTSAFATGDALPPFTVFDGLAVGNLLCVNDHRHSALSCYLTR